jgi:hypothetical protein
VDAFLTAIRATAPQPATRPAPPARRHRDGLAAGVLAAAVAAVLAGWLSAPAATVPAMGSLEQPATSCGDDCGTDAGLVFHVEPVAGR